MNECIMINDSQPYSTTWAWWPGRCSWWTWTGWNSWQERVRRSAWNRRFAGYPRDSW